MEKKDVEEESDALELKKYFGKSSRTCALYHEDTNTMDFGIKH